MYNPGEDLGVEFSKLLYFVESILFIGVEVSNLIGDNDRTEEHGVGDFGDMVGD